MIRCRDLEPHINLLTELETENHKGNNTKEQTDVSENDSFKEHHTNQQPMIFTNTAYYYLYYRLVDFLSSRDIVNLQISQVVKACQPGEVVIRDSLYRLGVAQINTDEEEIRLETQAEEGEEKQQIVVGD